MYDQTFVQDLINSVANQWENILSPASPGLASPPAPTSPTSGGPGDWLSAYLRSSTVSPVPRGGRTASPYPPNPTPRGWY